jgi:hypothetical protein
LLLLDEILDLHLPSAYAVDVPRDDLHAREDITGRREPPSAVWTPTSIRGDTPWPRGCSTT